MSFYIFSCNFVADFVLPTHFQYSLVAYRLKRQTVFLGVSYFCSPGQSRWDRRMTIAHFYWYLIGAKMCQPYVRARRTLWQPRLKSCRRDNVGWVAARQTHHVRVSKRPRPLLSWLTIAQMRASVAGAGWCGLMQDDVANHGGEVMGWCDTVGDRLMSGVCVWLSMELKGSLSVECCREGGRKNWTLATALRQWAMTRGQQLDYIPEVTALITCYAFYVRYVTRS